MSFNHLRHHQYSLLSLVQIAMYIATYEVLWRAVRWWRPFLRSDIFWGITAKYSVVIFGVLSIVGALASKYILPRYKWLIYSCCTVIFFALVVGTWSYMPYRYTLLLFCAVIGFWVPFAMLMILTRSKLTELRTI